jgi:hypothetical protein
MRFIPLASEISMGAIAPRNREGIKDETKDIREVELYASGYKRNILKWMSRYYFKRPRARLTRAI